jgi:hypothetical protein
MTYLPLHLRARRVPAAVTAALGPAGCAWLGWFLASDHREVGAPLASVSIMLACVAVSLTLAGDDEALERTGSRPWPRVRAAHLLIAFALLIGLFTASLATPLRFGSVAFLTRDIAGLLGLTALGAVLLGAQRAWFGPVLLSVLSVIWGAPTSHHGLQVLTWTTQPTGTTASTMTAIVLAVIGGGAYVYGRTGLPRSESL